MEDYRGPTPATLAGARVVQAEALWKPSAIFVNVFRPPSYGQLDAAIIWREPAQMSIFGSIGLPDTRYGALAR